MIVLPKRLIAFWVVVAAASIFGLVRGMNSEGQPGMVFTVLGVLGVASVLLFVVGWIRQSWRR